jgi:hypothetical protein
MVELKFTNFSTQVFFFGVSFFMMALFLAELKCRVPIRAEVECLIPTRVEVEMKYLHP